MNIQVLQLTEKNEHMFLFESWENVSEIFNINRYRTVWECNFEDDIASVPSTNMIWNLDKIYETFNINRPKNYYGHSMSVSDIVKIDDVYFYCDSFGWENITDKIK